MTYERHFFLCVLRERLCLVGVSDLAEVYALCSLDQKIELVGIFDPTSNRDRFAGLPVAKQLSDIKAFDALLIADTQRPQDTFDRLCDEFPSDRILALPVLGIHRDTPMETSDE